MVQSIFRSEKQIPSKFFAESTSFGLLTLNLYIKVQMVRYDTYIIFDRFSQVKNGPPTNVSTDSNSSSSSQLESPTANNPPSVQHTCSQLIKAGLKLTIEQKRKLQQDCDDFLDLDKCSKRPRKTECSESEEDKTKLESGVRKFASFS